jgi:hypothetical protein
MLKSGEKLRKLFMLLATWGLLLAFFIAYERYFIMGQREFLKDDGFRALTTITNVALYSQAMTLGKHARHNRAGFAVR